MTGSHEVGSSNLPRSTIYPIDSEWLNSGKSPPYRGSFDLMSASHEVGSSNLPRSSKLFNKLASRPTERWATLGHI